MHAFNTLYSIRIRDEVIFSVLFRQHTFQVGSHSFFKALVKLHAQRRMDTIQTPCVEALLQNTSNRNNSNQWPITPLAEPSRPQFKWWCDTVCLRIACKSDMPDPVTNVGRSTWRGPRAGLPLELLWPVDCYFRLVYTRWLERCLNLSTKITVTYTYLHRNKMFHNDCLRFFVSF